MGRHLDLDIKVTYVETDRRPRRSWLPTRTRFIRLEPESAREKRVEIESVDHVTGREASLFVYIPEVLLEYGVEVALDTKEP